MVRMVHVFKFPQSIIDSVEWPEMPKSVGLRQLTAEEEITASKIGKFDLTKTRYEGVKLSICQLGGQKVSNADGAVDKFWDHCGPKVRTLLLQAYDQLSGVKDAEEQNFLGSVEIQTG